LLCGECCIGNPEVKKLPGRVGSAGRIILKYILKERILWEGVIWINLSQDQN
jgi:hypothetical protein